MATPFLSLAVALLALGYTVVAHRECQHYKVLNTADRASTRSQGNVLKCDQKEILTKAWYRFEGAAGSAMPTSPVPINRCGTHAPGWMEGSHPTVAEGIVTRKVCYHWSGKPCHWNNAIRVRSCGGFYVYELNRPPVCHLRYCGNGVSAPSKPLECRSYKKLDTADRAAGRPRGNVLKCDQKEILTKAWYRFEGAAGSAMPTSLVPINRCGTHAPGWMEGSHPTVAEGIVTRKVCYHWSGKTCHWNNAIRVRNCGGFYVYELNRPPVCHLRYCGNAEFDVNECSKNPCKNGGVCKNEHGGYSCACKAGFTGKNCEQDVNECSVNPCKNGGVCKNEHGGYSCACKAGFTGKNCEQAPSKPLECRSYKKLDTADRAAGRPRGNVLKCDQKEILTKAWYRFEGAAGSAMPTSLVPINRCGTHAPGWMEGSHPTVAEGIVVRKVCYHWSGKTCHWNNAIRVRNCGGFYVYELNRPPVCHLRYCGNAEFDVNECSKNPCKNGGVCKNEHGGYSCACKVGFTGKNCEQDVNECSVNPCKNGGVCKNEHGGYSCACKAGFTGKNCEQDVNECSVNPCKNGGVCKNEHGGYSCACKAGFTGKNCEQAPSKPRECRSYKKLDTADRAAGRPRGNVLKCDQKEILTKAWYRFEGAAGSAMPTSLVPINRCGTHAPGWMEGSHPTVAEGIVVRKVCYHWSGKTCHWNNAIRVRNCGGFYVYELNRPPVCHLRYCGNAEFDVNECSINPCKNGGVCKNEHGGYSCACKAGFTGKNCEQDVNECSVNPCKNGGVCKNEHGGYSCACKAGFTGKNCEQAPSKPRECRSYKKLDTADRAAGRPRGNVLKCDQKEILTKAWYRFEGAAGSAMPTSLVPINRCGTHAPGWMEGSHPTVAEGIVVRKVCYHWSGKTCHWNNAIRVRNCGGFYVYELNRPPVCHLRYCGNAEFDVNECSINPCKNGGVCKNEHGGYSCACKAGFTGKNCEQDVNECSVNPCKNGGVCKNEHGGYSCACKAGFTGKNCEQAPSKPLECRSYKKLDTADRAAGRPRGNVLKCDQKEILTKAWYRFEGAAGSAMPTSLVPINRCGTHAPGWMEGSHPTVAEGIVTRKVCYHWSGKTCHWNNAIRVRNCGGFYVYELNRPPVCHLRYCGNAEFETCSSKPCKNGGTCREVNGAYSCTCKSGFTGKNCEQDVNECSKNPCKNGGVCKNEHGGYSCACKVGFTGKICEQDVNECSENPCKNGGVCKNEHGGYSCACKAGFTGKNCEQDVNECSENPCKNGGVCKNEHGGYSCACKAGFTGKNCEQDVNECSKNPCQNGGVCKNEHGGYSCACKAGFTGKICEQDVNECNKNPCQNGGVCKNEHGGYSCTCKAGFTGKNCEQDVNECSKNPCKNGGVCKNEHGGYSCACKAGFTGKICEQDVNECSENPCKNGGVCKNEHGGYSCACKAGFTGKNCEQDVNECSENPCKNGGVCKNEHGGYSCACKAGFMGKNCEQDVNECSKNPCQNGGVCKNEHGGYSCACKAGFTGKNCEQDVNECSKNPCKNDGVCKNEHGGYSCACKAGFTGKNCEQDMNECSKNPCQNGGVCKNKHGGYSCACKAGFTGKNCEQDVNECSKYPCQNGGVCKNEHGGYSCACKAEFTGKNCEQDVNECSKNPCKNGGVCKNEHGGYSCTCKAGFTGKTCEQDVNECSKNPCKNGGVCKNEHGGYSCTCKAGFTGKICEQDVNECSKNPCKNGGVCKNEHGGHSCTCKAGFTGKNCEQDVNECSKNPCKNGGVCKNEHGGYSCTCKAGFTGKNCEQDVNECSTNPCQNGGVCKNEHGGYSCVCKAGFTGKNCEQDVDECAGVNPCHHGGVCSNSHGGYSCKCASGYTGKNCEQDKNECKVNPCLNNGKCINTPGSYKCNCIDEYTGKHCETEPQEPGAPKYKELGCYKDNGNDKNKPRRTIPEMIANFRPQIDWHDMSKTVNECAKHAKEKGYEIFGVQFYGECYSGPTAEIDYERDGKAERGKCWAGVGGPSTNMVYRIE
ncbi:neurogenic locus notch homolog protein 1 isoform X13 [Nematostella vectensis]|uniref:neurogenic locus notch homolog protein 1 isoform X13 n=1 Tax=Nematostella vectensis TaxID=45351 RepID=UPI002076F741|nr:neurogenic locus notch homolog protein 1 isoform X13 [Nematostella vectensis]